MKTRTDRLDSSDQKYESEFLRTFKLNQTVDAVKKIGPSVKNVVF